MSILSNLFAGAAEKAAAKYLRDQLADLVKFWTIALAIYPPPKTKAECIRWVKVSVQFVIDHGTPSADDVKAHLGGK
jgi:hypothetical protein